jgi:hypothetical protein
MDIAITTSRIVNRDAALHWAGSFRLTDRAKRIAAFLKALQHATDDLSLNHLATACENIVPVI